MDHVNVNSLAEFLLVEDEEADIHAVQRAFKKSKIANKLNVVRNGEEAMAYLRREENYKDSTRPDLILLDLNMPKMDGKEVLKLIKSDPDLRMIPVAVMTSSKSEQDVFKSYDLGANCYIKKPLDLAELNRVIESLESFWLGVVTLCPKTESVVGN